MFGLWSFLEALEQAADLDEMERAYLSALDELGFVYGGLMSHVDPATKPANAVIFYRAPTAWVEQYVAMKLHRFNALQSEARRRPTPLAWNDPAFRARLTADEQRFMREKEAAGIAGGVTFPIHSSSALPASCSLVPVREGTPHHHYLLGYSISTFVHECAQRLAGATSPVREVLTERERACLILVARGKSDWAISELLGVSEGAVHKTIERAKHKLGVATRVQALMRAIHNGSIRLSDVAE